MEAQDGGFAAKGAGLGGPDGVVPAPFQPHDIRPGDGLCQGLARGGGDEAHIVVAAQRGDERGEEAVRFALHAVGEKEAGARYPAQHTVMVGLDPTTFLPLA